jgi:hypothetical protein
VSRREVLRSVRVTEGSGSAPDPRVPPSRIGGEGIPGRRTVTIRGQGAERYVPRQGAARRAGGSERQRQRQLRAYERSGFRPDRVAMWAVLLGVMLVVVAATSAHAAVHGVDHVSVAHAIAALGLR